jgi:hypothetical protein
VWGNEDHGAAWPLWSHASTSAAVAAGRDRAPAAARSRCATDAPCNKHLKRGSPSASRCREVLQSTLPHRASLLPQVPNGECLAAPSREPGMHGPAYSPSPSPLHPIFPKLSYGVNLLQNHSSICHTVATCQLRDHSSLQGWNRPTRHRNRSARTKPLGCHHARARSFSSRCYTVKTSAPIRTFPSAPSQAPGKDRSAQNDHSISRRLSNSGTLPQESSMPSAIEKLCKHEIR